MIRLLDLIHAENPYAGSIELHTSEFFKVGGRSIPLFDVLFERLRCRCDA